MHNSNSESKFLNINAILLRLEQVIKDLTVVIKSLTESVEGKEKKVMHCLGANATS